MKRAFMCALFVLGLITLLALPANAQSCTTIQSGLLAYQPGSYLAGQPITTGVNPYGYNYQAHSYNGNFFNVYANTDGLPPYDGNDATYLAAHPAAASHWAWPYRSQDVAMKWNDAWLSNQDCDGDGRLDRHYGSPSYVGSGAWLTNHDSWDVVNAKGRTVSADDFLKVVALPADAVIAGPVSYFGELTPYLNGKVLGAQLWGDFIAVQYVLNDPSTGDHGLKLKGQVAAGFGFYK